MGPFAFPVGCLLGCQSISCDHIPTWDLLLLDAGEDGERLQMLQQSAHFHENTCMFCIEGTHGLRSLKAVSLQPARKGLIILSNCLTYLVLYSMYINMYII